MSLEQIKVLHQRSGESVKERSRLFKQLSATERDAAIEDAIANNKSLIPFGRG